MAVRTFRERAIVLRTYRLGEADRIVVFFGEETGQFRAVAKGVRRSRSKFGYRLESFNLVDVQAYRGKELHTVTQVELISPYSQAVAVSYPKFTNAKLVAETAQKLTDGHDASPEQFTLLHGALAALGRGDRPATLISSSYLLRALAIEGWEPVVAECAQCGSGDLSGFSTTAGGTVCSDCAPGDTFWVAPETVALLRDLLIPNWPAALSRGLESHEPAAKLAGAWAQWHLEQRLRSLPFAVSGRGDTPGGGR